MEKRMSTPYTNVFTSSPVQPSPVTYNAIALTANTNTFWPVQNLDTRYVIAQIMDITPNVGPFNLILPDARKVGTGTSFIITNVGAHTFILTDNSSNPIINPAGTGLQYFVYLTDNTTANGTWRVSPFAAGGPGVTSLGITQDPSGGVVITGTPGLPLTTAGTLNFTLGANLAPLNALAYPANAGFPALTAAHTFTSRTITGTANQITVAPGTGNGVAGNPTLSLPNTVNIQNISICAGGEPNTIGTLAGNLKLTPVAGSSVTISAATGSLNLLAATPLTFTAANANTVTLTTHTPAASCTYYLPDALPLSGQVLSSVGAATPFQLTWVDVDSFQGPSTDDAVARFDGTAGRLQNSGVIISDTNNMDVPGSVIANEVIIGGALGANTVTTELANQSLLLSGNGTGIVQISGFNHPNINFSPGNANQPGHALILSTDSTSLRWAAIANQNLLINGFMNVSQRNTTFTTPNNNTYTLDMWKLMSNGNGVVTVTALSNASMGAGVYSAANTYLRATVVTPNTKFGILQVVPNAIAQSLYTTGGSLSLMVRVTTASSVNLKFSIVTWAGTADAPTTNTFINAWNAGGTPPTLGANWAFAGSANFTTQNVWTFCQLPAIAISSAATNVGVFIWDDSAALSAADTVDISCVHAEIGSSFTKIQPESFTVALTKAQQFYQKSYDYADVPAAATKYKGARTFRTPANIAINTVMDTARFQQTFFAVPTIVTYSPLTGTAAILSSVGTQAATADYAAGSATVATTGTPANNVLLTGRTSFSIYTTGALTTVNDMGAYQWTGDCSF